MTLARVKELLGLPAVIAAALLAVWGAFDWLKRIVGADQRLTVHIVAETVYHKRSDSAVKELGGHATDLERLLESMVRGECLENPRADLARQGLLAKCRQLGIER